jgi:hypothetical protein
LDRPLESLPAHAKRSTHHSYFGNFLERETGIEPATNSLEG